MFRKTSKKGGAPRVARGRRVPFVAQLTPTDCGIACLSAALSLHGKELSTNDVRARLGGGRNGVTARQIAIAAREFGLRARGVEVGPQKLQFLPPGSILHWDLNHFVVFEALTRTGIDIMDPAVGRRHVKLEDVSKSLTGVAIVVEPGDAFVREKRSKKSRFRRYRSWLWGGREVWLRVIVSSLFLQVIALALPGLTSVLVDKVVPRADSELLTLVVCAFITVASFHFLSSFLRARLLLQLRTRVESRMSFEFIDHLLDLPYGFFQQRSAGDIMMRLSSQASIRELLTTGALSALLDGAMVSIYFVLLVGAAPIMAGIALGLSVLQGVIYMIAGRRNRALVIESLASQARLEGYQVEMLSGMETLKAMGSTLSAGDRWSNLYVDVLNRSIVRGELEGTFGALIGALRFAGPVALLLAGAYLVLSGELSLGVMLGLSALGSGFLEPVSNLVGTAMQLTHLKGYMERIEDVLDAPTERKDGLGQNQASALRLRGGLRLESISFRYPGEARPTLENVSFEVQPGQSIAIVGSSGSGKSTLARILAGLYEPDTGRVFYDEHEAGTLHLPSLRDRLGVVTQDVRLFSGSIRENVAMFEPTVSEERVHRACELAALHADIMRMPMGYDTVLADGGSSLSGGQRQRLALARALVRGPNVLVLDEATSALDTVTEAIVQQNLRAAPCTRVVVAHRLSTIVEADTIIVLDHGKIVGMGRHEELLRACSAYRKLVRAQREEGAALDDASNAPHQNSQGPTPAQVSRARPAPAPAQLAPAPPQPAPQRPAPAQAQPAPPQPALAQAQPAPPQPATPRPAPTVPAAQAAAPSHPAERPSAQAAPSAPMGASYPVPHVQRPPGEGPHEDGSPTTTFKARPLPSPLSASRPPNQRNGVQKDAGVAAPMPTQAPQAPPQRAGRRPTQPYRMAPQPEAPRRADTRPMFQVPASGDSEWPVPAASDRLEDASPLSPPPPHQVPSPPREAPPPDRATRFPLPIAPRPPPQSAAPDAAITKPMRRPAPKAPPSSERSRAFEVPGE